MSTHDAGAALPLVLQDEKRYRGAPVMKATKCDLCIDQPGGPACQRACPHDALERVDMRDLPNLLDWLHR